MGCNPSRLRTHRIGGSTTEWRISMYAPPLADASLDRRLQNAYKSTRRGEALRTRGAPKTSGARVSGRWCERTRNTRRCQESWLTDNTQTLAFSGCFVVRKYTTSLTTLRILLLRGHRWFRIRCTPSVHRRDQLAALHEGILHPIPSNLQTRFLASGVFGFPVVHASSGLVEPMEKSGLQGSDRDNNRVV